MVTERELHVLFKNTWGLIFNVSFRLRREPTVLGLDISRTIKPRLEGLSDLLPGQNVTSMVSKIPRLLTSDVSGMVQKVVHVQISTETRNEIIPMLWVTVL